MYISYDEPIYTGFQKDDDSQDTPVPPSPEEEVPASQFDYVYSQGVDGYEVYRIPAIVKTQSNTLLAFAEARKARSNGDSGDIDLVVKRSSDNSMSLTNVFYLYHQQSEQDFHKYSAHHPISLFVNDMELSNR